MGGLHESWSTNFCGCFSDGGSCCLTLCCPCVSFGRVAEIIDRGTTSCCMHGFLYCVLGGFTHFLSVYGCIYRTKFRRVYGIEGSQFCDCLASCLCAPLSICQEYRELQARGFDVSAGWNGNVRMGTRGVMEAPMVYSGMTR